MEIVKRHYKRDEGGTDLKRRQKNNSETESSGKYHLIPSTLHEWDGVALDQERGAQAQRGAAREGSIRIRSEAEHKSTR